MMWDKNVLFIYWKYTEVVFLCQQILNNIFIKHEKVKYRRPVKKFSQNEKIRMVSNI